MDAILTLLGTAASHPGGGRESLPRLMQDTETRRQLVHTLAAMWLVAPETVREKSQAVSHLAWAIAADESKAPELLSALEDLVQSLHDDLVPERMR